jgi:hypothetical protein
MAGENGMFDYVMILASIVIGLALAHLMQGIVTLITSKVKVWWVHLVWVAFMLLMSVGWWWWEYTLHEVVRWTFAIYVFVLMYAFTVYLTSALLFPRDFDGHHSYETYFISHRRWFFGLQIALSLIDLLDSTLKGPAHMRSLGSEYLIASGSYVILAIVGIATPRKGVQAFIALVYLLYQISWMAMIFQTMQ